MLVRLGIVGSLWTLFHVYVGAHVLGPAPIVGLTRMIAWAGVILVAWLPLVALFAARRDRAEERSPGFAMRVLDWAAYSAMGLSSLLIVSFVVIDLLRLPNTVQVVGAVVSGAAFLTLLGIVLARRPRVVRVTVPIADLPSDLVAVTGDVADGLVPDLREHVAPLGRLRAPHGAYFVTGNHEYYWDVRGWIAELERLVSRCSRTNIGSCSGARGDCSSPASPTFPRPPIRRRRSPVRRRATCACCWRTSRAVRSPHRRRGTTSSSPGTPTAGSISPSICWCGYFSRSWRGCIASNRCGSTSVGGRATGGLRCGSARRRRLR